MLHGRLFAVSVCCWTFYAMSTGSLDEKQASPVQDGTIMVGDEAELARMGYKQELRCVFFSRSSAFIIS